MNSISQHQVEPQQNSAKAWFTADLIAPPADTPVDASITNLDFMPFSQAPLWKKTVDDEQSLFPAPVLINTYARLIIHYVLES